RKATAGKIESCALDGMVAPLGRCHPLLSQFVTDALPLKRVRGLHEYGSLAGLEPGGLVEQPEIAVPDIKRGLPVEPVPVKRGESEVAFAGRDRIGIQPGRAIGVAALNDEAGQRASVEHERGLEAIDVRRVQRLRFDVQPLPSYARGD